MPEPWKQLTPVLDEVLGSDQLQSRGELFAVSEVLLLPEAPRAPHWHESYELGWVRGGQGVIAVGEAAYPYRAGQVYVVNPLEPHMAYAEGEPSEISVVYFHSMLLDEGWIARSRREARLPFTRGVALEPLLPLENPVNSEVRDLLERIQGLTQGRRPMWEVLVGGLLIQAVGLLAAELAPSAGQHEAEARRRALRRIAPSLRLIERHFAEPLSLERIVTASNLAQSQCCELFGRALGMSPVAYRNARRLTEAQRLLERGGLSVQEVAYRVGFGSAQELNRLFRRQYGMTPSEFVHAVPSSREGPGI